jgi:polyhydroxybutyrate depolymerase
VPGPTDRFLPRRLGPEPKIGRFLGDRSFSAMWVPLTAITGVSFILLSVLLSTLAGGGSGDSPTAAGAGPSGSGGSVAATAHAATAAPSSAAPTPTQPSGCVTGKRLPVGAGYQTIKVGGVARSYHLAVPASATTTTALPLLFSFHAAGESPETVEGYTHFVQQGNAAGYIVVTPRGAAGRWNFVRRAAAGPDDVAFISGVLADLTVRTCVDQNRIFAAGMGDGADMALTLACALPGRLAAVVPVASSILPASCPSPGASLLAIQGTADQVTPYNGGGPDRAPPLNGTVTQPVEQRVARYAAATGCGPATTRIQTTSTSLNVRWTSCPSGLDVGIVAFQGGGHVWPDSSVPAPAGSAAADFSATEIALAFFQGHPRRSTTPAGG